MHSAPFFRHSQTPSGPFLGADLKKCSRNWCYVCHWIHRWDWITVSITSLALTVLSFLLQTFVDSVRAFPMCSLKELMLWHKGLSHSLAQSVYSYSVDLKEPGTWNSLVFYACILWTLYCNHLAFIMSCVKIALPELTATFNGKFRIQWSWPASAQCSYVASWVQKGKVPQNQTHTP